jgi:DNA polymerase I-like protein with 3'-5' exonuclease and polymerase domains
MIAAYLLGLPQGLKELASRLCGIKMTSYLEVVRPGQRKLSTEYLTRASKREFPDPPVIEETKWDNKAGGIVTKIKKPWHISRKIAKIMTDMTGNSDVDPYVRWRQIPNEERACVEKVLGEMPESSLADIKFEDAVRYSITDADATLRVKLKLEKLLREADMDFIFHIDIGILPMICEMMQTGMAVNIPYLKELSQYYSAGMVEAAAKASTKVGHAFNPSSSKQVATVVYGELGFKPSKTTATGLICTDDRELKKVNHLVIADILTYRRLNKNKGTFSDSLVENAICRQENGQDVYRVHTTLKTTRTDTGRLSSSDPINLQTMPTRSEEGKKIRKSFKFSPGFTGLAGDFIQQEMKVQAHLAQCKLMLDVFRQGVDFHTATAAKIFGVPMDVAEQKKYRYPAKCFHPDTEVLTPDGWKRITDLTLGVDKVMQAIPGNNGNVKLEWALPAEVFTTKHPSGRLVHLRNYGIDLRVTPDHRMLAWQTQKHRVVAPHEMDKQRCWANAGIADGSIDVDERLLRLAVATEADGSYSWRRVRFGFYNECKIARLRELAQGEIVESMGSNGKLRPVQRMCLSRDLSDKVRELLDSDKSFPWWWLGLTASLRSIVLDELKYWDGGQYGGWAGMVYSSGNQKSRDVVQAIGAITGRKNSQCHKLSITGHGTYPIHQVLIKNHALTRGGNLKVTDERYDGEVACLSMPSSFVLVRSGGIPVITGQTMNFAVIYLISPKGLAETIHENAVDIIVDGKPIDVSEWTEESCGRLIEDWYKMYPEVRDYQMETIAFARRHGYVVDMFGRRRYSPEVSCPIRDIRESGERAVVNMPVQSSSQGITKLAMAALWCDWTKMGRPESLRWLMQIHDEVMAEVTSGEESVRKWARWLKYIMDHVVTLSIPMTSDVKAGENWAEMKKVDLVDE